MLEECSRKRILLLYGRPVRYFRVIIISINNIIIKYSVDKLRCAVKIQRTANISVCYILCVL